MKLVLFLFAFYLIGFYANSQCPIVPKPTSYVAFLKKIKLKNVTIDTSHVNPSTVRFLEDNLNKVYGIETEKVNFNGLISFSNIRKDKGSYMLIIDDVISIDAPNDTLIFNGVVSLLQLIQFENEMPFVTAAIVDDQPKFDWRGLHLDVSRHFYSVDEVKRFIDLMTLYKFNKFHWHLTDDQGWRIEIKKYPKLTEIGAFRDSTLIGHYSDSPRLYDGQKYDGFYTQEDIKEVIHYANKHFIEVIPEIELPGHSRAALSAYPEYSCTGIQQPVAQVWGIFDDIYCSKQETRDFLKDILAEVVTLFPSEYIHIGGDEAPKTRWKTCEECQNVMTTNELLDEHELQSFFIRDMDAFLTSKGKKLIGWDEILEGGLSPNAAVMSWRGESGGIEAAKQGHHVVMSPTTYCYFDYYQSSNKNEPLAIGGYLPLEKVYQFNPLPKELTPLEQELILGGQANLWTEYIPNMAQLEYMTYPRALALSQSLWCIDKPNYNYFLSTVVQYQETFLERYEVNYSQSIHYPEIVLKRMKNGISIDFKSPNGNEFFAAIKFEDGTETARNIKINKENTIDIFKSTDGKTKDVHIDLTSGHFEGVMNYNFIQHDALGMEIEMLTIPSPNYNNNGSLNLVDGIKGQIPWKGSEWLGFRDSIVEFIVDLEEGIDLSGIKLGFLEQNGSWIYLPESVVVFESSDKESWRRVSENNIVELEDDSNDFIVNLESSKRYLKVKVFSIGTIQEGMEGGGNAPWTFIDEFQIIRR